MNFNYKKVMEAYRQQLLLYSKSVFCNDIAAAKENADAYYVLGQESIKAFSYEELEQYSKQNIKERYAEDTKDDNSFLIIDTINIGVGLLLIYDLTLEQYIKWVNMQNSFVRTYLYGLVGLSDKADEEKAIADRILLDKMIHAEPPKDSYIKIVDTYTEQGDNCKLLNLHGKIVILDSAVVKDNEIRKTIEKKALEQSEIFEKQYIEELKSVKNLTQNVLEIATDCIFEAIRESVKILRKFGVRDISEDVFIKTYHRDFDYSCYYKTLQEILLQIVVEACSDRESEAIKRQLRSSWQGGGIGISGAIKGALMAEILNAGAGAFYSIKDYISDKSSEYSFIKRIETVFRDEKMLDYLKTGVKNCCQGVLRGIQCVLSENGVVKNLGYSRDQDQKILNAISNATNIADGDLLKSLLSCIQYYPYDEDIYVSIYRKFGDGKKELQQIVEFFGVSSEYKRKIKEVNKTILKVELALPEETLEQAVFKRDEICRVAQTSGLDIQDELNELDRRIEKKNIQLLVWNKQIDELEKMALKNNKYAQYALTEYYLFSEGLPRGDIFRKVDKMARDGVPFMQYLLGRFFNQGFTVSQDINTAIYWYKKAEDNKCTLATPKLCFQSLYGRYSYGSKQECFDRIQKCAEDDDVNAQFDMYLFYRDGTCGHKIDYYKRKYWESVYEKNKIQLQKPNVKSSSSDCYITTATCTCLGKGDSCSELMLFRSFRDNWLAKSLQGQRLIREYYNTAPLIVEKINTSKNRISIYHDIWDLYLVKCMKCIMHGKYEKCLEIYIVMIEFLKKLYL